MSYSKERYDTLHHTGPTGCMIVSHDLVRPPTVGQMVHLKLTQICLDDVGVIVHYGYYSAFPLHFRFVP